MRIANQKNLHLEPELCNRDSADHEYMFDHNENFFVECLNKCEKYQERIILNVLVQNKKFGIYIQLIGHLCAITLNFFD